MSTWAEVTWTVARAGGFISYILVALSVALGLALSMKWHSPRWWPRLVNSELHNFTTLLSLVFIVVHVLAVWIDPFTRFGVAEVFVPFASHYRPLWMALGIIALYLGIAVALSTLIRSRIGYAWWHRLHLLTLALFVIVTVHGIATGSDTRTWWGMLIYLGAVLLVGGLLCMRLLAPVTPQGRAHPGVALACALLVMLGAGWVAAGPLQPGWNAVANNGQGSGARVALATGGASGTPPAATPSDPPATGTSGGTSGGSAGGGNIAGTTIVESFEDDVQGTVTQGGTDAAPTLQMQLQADGSLPGALTVSLTGQQNGDGSISLTSTNLTFAPTAGGSFSGALTDFETRDSRWQIHAVLSDGSGSGQGIQVLLRLRIDDEGDVRGILEGIPSGGASSSNQPPTSPYAPISPNSPSVPPSDGGDGGTF